MSPQALRKSYSKTMAEVDARGIRFEVAHTGRHLAMLLPGGKRLTFSVSCSDRRADMKQRSILRRLLQDA